jgi:PEP-CTERM motif
MFRPHCRTSTSDFHLSVPFLLLITLIYPAATARADEIAVWNFNDQDLSVDHGVGTLTSTFSAANLIFTLGGSTLNARLGDIAGQALTLQGGTGNGNNGELLTFAVSTVGFEAIVVSLATQATSTGFNANQFQYSLDGVTFVSFQAPYAPPAAYGLFTFDLSGIAGLANNPNAAFRIIFNGASSSSGNNRLDNLVVEGSEISSIPEPASMTLLGLGLVGAASARRRKKRRVANSRIPGAVSRGMP